ncbi:hypothetical protein [Streptomyces platensis]
MTPVPTTDRTRPFSAETRDETAALLIKALSLGLDFHFSPKYSGNEYRPLRPAID